MLKVRLVGADTCHRYQLMREIVLDETARAAWFAAAARRNGFCEQNSRDGAK
jgi:hypothetical protein